MTTEQKIVALAEAIQALIDSNSQKTLVDFNAKVTIAQQKVTAALAP